MKAIYETADYIKQRIPSGVKIGLVLGSGLGQLTNEMTDTTFIPYKDIPNFPVTTAPGHEGQIVYGKLNNVPVLVMKGRFHFYEGHAMSSLVLPIRVFKMLNIKTLLITNAAGAVNEKFKPGDFMIITDHINLSGQNPLIGNNDEALGPRFPDLNGAYTPSLVNIAKNTSTGLTVHEGVYAWFSGPSFETPAEIRMARILGADAVGMSTVPEVIAAKHAGINVLAISCITNMAAGILKQPITSEEVLEIAAKKHPEFVAWIKGIVPQLINIA